MILGLFSSPQQISNWSDQNCVCHMYSVSKRVNGYVHVVTKPERDTANFMWTAKGICCQMSIKEMCVVSFKVFCLLLCLLAFFIKANTPLIHIFVSTLTSSERIQRAPVSVMDTFRLQALHRHCRAVALLSGAFLCLHELSCNKSDLKLFYFHFYSLNPPLSSRPATSLFLLMCNERTKQFGHNTL